MNEKAELRMMIEKLKSAMDIDLNHAEAMLKSLHINIEYVKKENKTLPKYISDIRHEYFMSQGSSEKYNILDNSCSSIYHAQLLSLIQ